MTHVNTTQQQNHNVLQGFFSNSDLNVAKAIFVTLLHLNLEYWLIVKHRGQLDFLMEII